MKITRQHTNELHKNIANELKYSFTVPCKSNANEIRLLFSGIFEEISLKNRRLCIKLETAKFAISNFAARSLRSVFRQVHINKIDYLSREVKYN